MKIGIDIDNVISSFNIDLFNEYLEHDKNLRNNGIINPNASYIRKGMFDWTESEETDFYKNNIERIAKNLNTIDDASKYINKLKDEGHEIFIISGRDNGEYTNPYNMTIEWLNNNDVVYDELILTNSYKHYEKADICIKKNIDIMIDDSIRVCKACFDKRIKPILFDTEYNRGEESFKRVKNWKEVYEYISSYHKEKINVILDTDTYNECDDQFALAYMIKSQDVFNIEAITVAPYLHKKYSFSIKEGQQKSYNEILKISNWLNFDTTNRIFKGSEDYISNGYDEYNDAVNRIIEIALKNDRTYILAIGAITNVALAVKKEPLILDKIEIVWLGGNELGYQNNIEYNFKQDVDAVKILFNSNAKLTIIPCQDVASILKTDINILNRELKDKNELCNYLIKRFYNDGYHGVQKERVIWDIAVIAYMINQKWFEIKEINCPNIKENMSYEVSNNTHKINFITKMNKDAIYTDLFRKLRK